MLKRLARLALNTATCAATLFAAAHAARADIHVGVTLSATGAAASLGIPEKNSVALMPREIAGQKIRYTVLDDESNPTVAVANARKLISDGKVDVILGSTITPNSLAMLDVIAEAGVAMISMAASASIIEPVEGNRRWAFKTPQNDSMMAAAIAAHMAANGIQTVGYIGFSDAYGEGWLREFRKAVQDKGIRLLAAESYARPDTSVTGQVLKLMAARPDAVFIAASGTPAALPQKTLKERGYQGVIYQSHGVANSDFLRVGGKDVEDTILPAGPVLVAAQLPDAHPVKQSALEYINAYEAAHGKGSVTTFGAHAWDGGRMLQAAIPAALAKAQPGTREFRAALRDAIENNKDVAGAHGIFNMSASDHLGLDARAVVMVKIENGAWKYLP